MCPTQVDGFRFSFWQINITILYNKHIVPSCLANSCNLFVFSSFIPKPLFPPMVGVNSRILGVLKNSLSRGSGHPQLMAELGDCRQSPHPQGSVSTIPSSPHSRGCPVTFSHFSRSHFLFETCLYLCLTTTRMWISYTLYSRINTTKHTQAHFQILRTSFGRKASYCIFGGKVRLGSQFPQGDLTSSPSRSCSDLTVN